MPSGVNFTNVLLAAFAPRSQKHKKTVKSTESFLRFWDLHVQKLLEKSASGGQILVIEYILHGLCHKITLDGKIIVTKIMRNFGFTPPHDSRNLKLPLFFNTYISVNVALQ
jgi:hypothetical protein